MSDTVLTKLPPSKTLQTRQLRIRGLAAKGRDVTWQGRTYYAVPVVALKEGVLWPVNAETPERVLASELAIAPAGWNGRPVFLDHPDLNGTKVSGNSPEILEKSQWGIVFNAASSQDVLQTKMLRFEAWLDRERAALVEGAANELARLEKGEVVEVSVGVFVLTDDDEGTFNGKKYKGTWRNIVPDHLAILPEGVTGACSVEMGCGAMRSNRVNVFTETGVDYEEETDMRTLRERLVDMIRATFSVNEGETATDVRRMLYEALRKEVGNSLLDLEDFYPDDHLVVYSAYDGNSYVEFRRGYSIEGNTITLDDNIENVRSRRIYEVVTAAAENPDAPTETAAPKAACGCQNENAQSGEEAMNKAERIAAIIANSNGRFTDADKPWLEAVPESRLSALEAQGAPTSPNQNPNPNTAPLTGQAPADTTGENGREGGREAGRPAAPASTPGATSPTSENAGETAEVRDNSRRLTLDEMIAAAETENPDLAFTFRSLQAETARKRTASITALKASGRNTFTDAELNAMPMPQLEKLVALANAQVDYSGNGVPRQQQDGNAANGLAAAPPDFTARVLALRGQGQQK